MTTTATAAQALTECGICFTEIPAADAVALDCGDEACTTCAAEHIALGCRTCDAEAARWEV